MIALKTGSEDIHMSTSEQSCAAVQAFFDAFGRGDMESAFARLAPEITWTYYGPDRIPFAGVFEGREGVRAFFDRVAESIAIKAMSVESLEGVGGTVYGRGFEHSEVLATGKAYNVQWAHVYKVRDGLLVSFEEFLDTAAVLACFD